MASKLTIKVKLKGAERTIFRLSRLKSTIQNRVHRNALTDAARKGVSIAKGYLKPRRTGLLSKAIAYKTKQSTRDRGYRVIGADKGFKTVVPGSNQWNQVTTNARRGVTVILSGKGKRNRMPRTAKIAAKGFNLTSGLNLDPAKYAHLVEGGRKANRPVKAKAMRFRVSAKRGSSSVQVWSQHVRRVQGQQFMRPASEKLALIFPWIMEQHLRKVT